MILDPVLSFVLLFMVFVLGAACGLIAGALMIRSILRGSGLTLGPSVKGQLWPPVVPVGAAHGEAQN